MTWLARLYETYENIKKLEEKQSIHSKQPLLPICHSIRNAHINIVIDESGNFKRAVVLNSTKIIHPSTEQSAIRCSTALVPHPLSDKLQYVAKDYPLFGGNKKSGFKEYKENIEKWSNSIHSHPKVKAVFLYIQKGMVIQDLINEGTLLIDEEKKLLTKWQQKDDIPAIFKSLPKDKGLIEVGDAFICWTVESPGETNIHCWEDVSLQRCWIDYDSSQKGTKGLCYLSGEESILATKHPRDIRQSGDQAKLISSNDEDGFTFRGKFSKPEQCLSIGYEVSQKAHNALRWLITNHGFSSGDQKFIAWAISAKEIPETLLFNHDFFTKNFDNQSEKNQILNTFVDHSIDLGKTFSQNLRKKMSGYRANLDEHENILVMSLDSATSGRLAITHYREYLCKDFLNNLEKWHIDFAWHQQIFKESQSKELKNNTYFSFLGSPIPNDIFEAVYGFKKDKSKESLKKKFFNTLIPCIIDGRQIPFNYLIMSFHRVCNKISYKMNQFCQWEKDLNTACALYKGFFIRHPIKEKRRIYSMSLDNTCCSRDYLYGRLLAIAERIEKVALNLGNEKRLTTAERLMQSFADKPYSTWRNIELSLAPYNQKLNSNRTGFLINMQKELDEVMSLFKKEDFIDNTKLSGEFLIAYHCQRQAWQNKFSNDEVAEENK